MAIAASSAAFGVANAAKKPSPVCWTTSPPELAICSSSSSLCRASSFFHFSLTTEELSGTLCVSSRADALERCMRGVELGDRGVLVAASAERDPEQDPSLGGLERSPDAAPLVPSVTEETYRLVHVAFGEGYAAGGDMNRCVERRSPTAPELVG